MGLPLPPTRERFEYLEDTQSGETRTLQLGVGHVILHSGPAWTPEQVGECGAVVDALAD